jgi:ADP-heptose:LPS heptosyltransferase
VILSLPVISQLKKLFPDAAIDFLINKKNAELIKNYPGINSIIIYDEFKNYSEKLRYFENEKYDIAISVFPRFEIALLFFLSGIKHRIGTAYRGYSFLFNEKIYEHRKYAEKHEAEYNLNLLKLITKDIPLVKEFYFSYTQDESENLNSKLTDFGFSLNKKFVIIHPGSKRSAKDWSIVRFTELTKLLLEEFADFRIVLSGISEESVLTKKIKNESGNSKSVIDLAGSLSLRELLILIDKSQLFISNSTGPIHIAGALNKKIIGFYPNEVPMNETRWKPLSEKAIVLKPESPGGNMDSITAEEVIEIIKILFL